MFRLVGLVLLIVAVLGIAPELAAVTAPDFKAPSARIIAAPLHPEEIASARKAAPAWKSASGIFHFSCPIASAAFAWEVRPASGFSLCGLRIRIGPQDPSGLDWEYVYPQPIMGADDRPYQIGTEPGYWRYRDGTPTNVPKPNDNITPGMLGISGNVFDSNAWMNRPSTLGVFDFTYFDSNDQIAYGPAGARQTLSLNQADRANPAVVTALAARGTLNAIDSTGRAIVEPINQIQDTVKVGGAWYYGIPTEFLELHSGMAAGAQVAVDQDRVGRFIATQVTLNALVVAGPPGLNALGNVVERASIARAGSMVAPQVATRTMQVATLTDDAGIMLFRNSPDVVLQTLTRANAAKLGANPSLARGFLSVDEYAAGARSGWLGNMQFGNAVERMVARDVQRFPALRGVLDYAGGAGRPDFYGRGLWQGATFDITTFGQIPTKFPGGIPKYPVLTVVPYARPAGAVPFPPLP